MEALFAIYFLVNVVYWVFLGEESVMVFGSVHSGPALYYTLDNKDFCTFPPSNRAQWKIYALIH